MTDPANLCMNCMSDKAGAVICPHCGFRGDEAQMQHALPPKTILQKRYLVGMAKESNGEGITYIGYDTVLNIPIKLREFSLKHSVNVQATKRMCESSAAMKLFLMRS
jgi:eukaryotic-like serine/threonine-protein kinase